MIPLSVSKHNDDTGSKRGIATATVRFKTWAPLPMSKTHVNTHTDADTKARRHDEITEIIDLPKGAELCIEDSHYPWAPPLPQRTIG